MNWFYSVNTGEIYSSDWYGEVFAGQITLFSYQGNEINNKTSPIEAGLSWIVKTNKKSDFIDKQLLIEQKNNGISKKLVGFELLEKGIPRHGYEIIDDHDNIICHVTSGTMSPSLKKPVGMGYIETRYLNSGSLINIMIRNKKIKAKIVSLPFL